MEIERINEVRNSIGKNDGVGLGKKNPISLHTDSKNAYRQTGFDQVEDIINTGYIRTKGYGVRAKNRGQIVYWSMGGEKLFYYDTTRVVLQVPINIIESKMNEALVLDDLTAIWVFDEKNNKYVNRLLEIKRSYLEKQKQNLETLESRHL